MASGIHRIMVPVRDDGLGSGVLAHAARVAQHFAAQVRIVHCHPRPDDLMPYGVVIPAVVRRQIEAAAAANVDVTAEQMVAEFKAQADALGLADEDHGSGKATCKFVEYEGKQVDAVRHFGRLADLICIPSPDKERNLGANTLKTALFSSGRPVMVCPHVAEPAPGICKTVAIAWNGSLEAARATALAMPLIEAAESVTILTAGDGDHIATPEEFSNYLSLRGIDATVRRFEARGIVGRALLEHSAEIGAGMLIMGAYHESFERETVFGGNSQAVVDHAMLPVVMVH